MPRPLSLHAVVCRHTVSIDTINTQETTVLQRGEQYASVADFGAQSDCFKDRGLVSGGRFTICAIVMQEMPYSFVVFMQRRTLYARAD